MLPVSQIANSPTAHSAPYTVLSASATDRVSTRLTPAAVSAPLPDTQPENTVRNGPSSTFLAQVLSQNNVNQQGNQIALASLFARFAPAPTYNELVGYSLVKYRPSDAGLPSAFTASGTPRQQSQGDVTQLAVAANDYQAYSDTQSRNQSNLSSTSLQLVVAG